MKGFLTLVLLIGLNTYVFAQTNTTTKTPITMKLNAGIVTNNLAETKAFYTQVLNFGVTFENEFYLLLHTPNLENEISFLLPHHPSQQSLFHAPFQEQGVYLTIEVEDVDKMYQILKEKEVEIKIQLRDEPWGDRHFAIVDPNGVAIDIVEYTAPVADNTTILKKANEAISIGDHEEFLKYCTDDTKWTFVGDQILKGKAAVREWMSTAYAEPPKFDVKTLIAEGDFVIAIGYITIKDKNGNPVCYSYCDVWRFRDHKMAELTAFVIEPKE